MPTRSSICALFRSFSKLSICFILIIAPFFASSQTLTGLWIGAVSNDSTTVRQDQSFEIVLTEYRGKVYGYSRNEFIVDDVLYYIVKRVEGTITGDVCEVTDDEIVACNFPKKPEKGVKVTSIFRRNGDGEEWYLDGTWKTNKTKNYYALSGKVSLAEEKDLTASKIFPHLEELKIAEEVAFYKERKEGLPVVKLVKPERDDKASYINPSFSTGPISIAALTQSTALQQQEPEQPEKKLQPTFTESATLSTPPGTGTASVSTDPELMSRKEPSAVEPLPTKKIDPAYTPTEKSSLAINNINNTSTEKPATNSQVKIERQEVPVTETVAANKPNTAATTTENVDYSDGNSVDLKRLRQSPSTNIPAVKPTEQKQQTSVSIKPSRTEPVIVSPIPRVTTAPHERDFAAMDINERRTEISQVVEFSATTDSIQIALYDNGQIDGDTVSVLLNGDVILSKKGLKATAIKHTIHLAAAVQEFNIVLYAENLGSLPPNTGLLVVRDGTDVYNLRFSSDYQKNTGIVFRRKK